MSVTLPGFRRLRCSFLVLFWLPAALLAAGLPVETRPPKIYRQHIEPVLTPLATILKLPVDAAAAGDSGLMLLDERLVAVDEQGRRTMAWHFAYKTLTEAGIKSNSEDVYRFDKHEQKAYLILAETIQPDGTRQNVQPNAVLLQSPQRQAQYSLYDDRAELKVIFPNVRAGSITHGIIIIEDLTTKLPGEFCQSFGWGGNWAAERTRYEINLPKSLEARLKIESLGRNIPTDTHPPASTGRVRHAWAIDHLRGERYEPGRPPADQAGPSLQLTTIASWDAIGSWYRGLLHGRDELKPELARLVDEWCKDLVSPADVVAALHTRVADDVRYVGLEFGAAAYQPHDCNEVWSLHYGDCKDKANLLVAMLRHRGIEAGIALVDTAHLGLVNRRNPSYQPFNHAIVAIPQAGGYLFCDPTIAFSPPGMTGNRTADRDVLVVTRTKTEWVRTPATTAGSLRYGFDLKLSDTGEIAGWLTLTADGYYGAGERQRYARLEPQEMRSTMSDIVRGFYPGAEVVDTERHPGARNDPYTVKAYFTVPGNARNPDQKRTLAFPMSQGLLPDLGNTAERQTTYFLDRDLIQIDATIALPAGYHVPTPPPAFTIDSGNARVRAQWSASADSYRAELEIRMMSAAVRRDEFGLLYQAKQALLAWLDHPLLIEAGAGATLSVGEPTIDFPLMPTGDGQINLADTRYPGNGDPALRRLALERTMQYFPNDPNTVLRASGRLAVSDWDAGRNDAAHERLAGILTAYAGKVTPENYAWARHVDGLVLRDLGREAEALAHLQAVSSDSRLSTNRRASAAPATAALLAKSNRPAAIALLQEVAELPEGATAAVEARLAQLLLEAGSGPVLAAHLQQLVQRRPGSAEEELADLLRAAGEWPAAGAAEGPVVQLASIVAGLIPQPGSTLKQLLANASTATARQHVKAVFSAAVAQPPLAEWNTGAAPLRVEDYDKAIAEADKKGDGAAGFRVALQAVIHLPADEGFPRRLWRAAIYADWTERQGTVPTHPAVVGGLLDLCDQLPSNDEYFIEGKLLRDSRLHRAKDYPAEIVLLQAALKVPDLPEKFVLALTRRVAVARESQGDYEDALRQYATVEALSESYQSAAESVLRMAFIRLHLGRDADALRSIELLRRAPPEVTKSMAGRDQAAELIQLVQSGQAEAVWRNGRAWWPQWRKYASAHLGTADTPGAIVPVVANLLELGTELGEAKRDKNNQAYFNSLDQLISAARWLPSYGIEVASLFTLTAGLVPGQAADFRNIVIAILAGPPPAGDLKAATARVQLAVHYIDGNLPAKALPVLRDLFEHPQATGEALLPGVSRLWGLAALAARAELPGATAALERTLSNPTLAEQRAGTVRILADLYHQLGRGNEERALLKRELANPTITTDAAGTKNLQSRLDQLAGEEEFGREVARWRETLGLPWYDYAEPASLADPRLRNLTAVLEQPDKHFLAAEKVKLFLLVAQDPQLPMAQRQGAIRPAANTLLLFVPTWTRFNQVAASVIDNPAFDLETRINTLWLALVYSVSAHRTDVYARWRKHALYESFNETYKKNVAALDEWAAHDPYSAESMLELAATHTDTEVTNFRKFILSDILNALVDLGDLEAAAKFVAMVPTLKPAADLDGTLPTRQLEFARQLRVARLADRIHARLSELVKGRYPGLADRLPDAYADLRVDAKLPACSPSDTLQACLYFIKTRKFSRKNFDFWTTLLRNLPRNGENEAFGCELLAAALAAAETDELKTAVVDSLVAGLDLDRPPVIAAVRKALAAGMDQTLYPDTYLRSKFIEIQVALRTGTLTDLDSYFAGLTNPTIPFFKQTLNLAILTRKKDGPAVARVVDGVSTELLLSPAFLRDAFAAMALLGRKEELEAVRTAARSELRKQVAQSWLAEDGEAITRIGGFSAMINDPELVPLAWSSQLGRSLTDPFKRLEVQLIAAVARDDWKNMARLGAELNRDYPTYYHLYWWRGLAEARLGHKAEARQALEVYVQYSKDEREYPDAVALLRELTTGK